MKGSFVQADQNDGTIHIAVKLEAKLIHINAYSGVLVEGTRPDSNKCRYTIRAHHGGESDLVGDGTYLGEFKAPLVASNNVVDIFMNSVCPSSTSGFVNNYNMTLTLDQISEDFVKMVYDKDIQGIFNTTARLWMDASNSLPEEPAETQVKKRSRIIDLEETIEAMNVKSSAPDIKWRKGAKSDQGITSLSFDAKYRVRFLKSLLERLDLTQFKPDSRTKYSVIAKFLRYLQTTQPELWESGIIKMCITTEVEAYLTQMSAEDFKTKLLMIICSDAPTFDHVSLIASYAGAIDFILNKNNEDYQFTLLEDRLNSLWGDSEAGLWAKSHMHDLICSESTIDISTADLMNALAMLEGYNDETIHYDGLLKTLPVNANIFTLVFILLTCKPQITLESQNVES